MSAQPQASLPRQPVLMSAQVLGSLPVPVVVTDMTLSAIHVNQAWRTFSTAPSDGNPWQTIFDSDELERISEHLRSAVENDRAMIFEARGKSPDQWLEVRVAQAEAPAALVIVVLDVSTQRMRESALTVEASRDSLTGLFNRRTLFEHLERALARLQRRTSTLSVAFIDIDKFKDVNDEHGHATGDRVLTSLADRLRRATRPTDILARVGGDEFVAVCEDLAQEHSASMLAHRIAATLVEPIRISPTIAVSLSASIGVAVTSDYHVQPSVLLDRADVAMYEARRRGTSVVQAETSLGEPRQERYRSNLNNLSRSLARHLVQTPNGSAGQPAGHSNNGNGNDNGNGRSS